MSKVNSVMSDGQMDGRMGEVGVWSELEFTSGKQSFLKVSNTVNLCCYCIKFHTPSVH